MTTLVTTRGVHARRAPWARRALTCAVGAAVVGLLLGGQVLAQEPPPVEQSIESRPSTTTPSGESPATSSTTTTAVDPLGASAEGLSSGAYSGQPPFELGSMTVLGSEVRSSRRALSDAEQRYEQSQAAIDATVTEFQRLAGQIEVIGIDREDKVASASAAKTSMKRRAVDAFVRGDESTKLLGVIDDPVEYSRAKNYLSALAGLDRDAMLDYQRRIAGLDDRERELVDDQADLQDQAAQLAVERSIALRALLNARRCAEAYRSGSHACPPTFVFPVLGDVTFAGTWGAPRMPGSVDQHWHEGTDIMAPTGREIVAVEDGTILNVGDAGLGGLRLWLRGASGIDYYYAHFSSFAAGMVDGTEVTAGTVLGFAGATGNAAGGAPHLHFEIHPGGGRPIDPYPLLKASWGSRTMPDQSRVVEGVPSARALLPPEER